MKVESLNTVENLVANGEISPFATMFSIAVCCRCVRKHLYIEKVLSSLLQICHTWEIVEGYNRKNRGYMFDLVKIYFRWVNIILYSQLTVAQVKISVLMCTNGNIPQACIYANFCNAMFLLSDLHWVKRRICSSCNFSPLVTMSSTLLNNNPFISRDSLYFHLDVFKVDCCIFFVCGNRLIQA